MDSILFIYNFQIYESLNLRACVCVLHACVRVRLSLLYIFFFRVRQGVLIPRCCC